MNHQAKLEDQEEGNVVTEVVKPRLVEGKKVLRGEVDVEKVTMKDGREVTFTGKRFMNKTAWVEGGELKARFDFRSGETTHFVCPPSLVERFALHGILQKIGDEAAGEKGEDAVVAIDAIASRLAKGEWGVERSSGGGFAGAGVVIRALMEVTGKSQGDIKAFLDNTREKTPGLTRQALYASFREHGLPTAKIIARIEAEQGKEKGKAAVNAGDLLEELQG